MEAEGMRCRSVKKTKLNGWSRGKQLMGISPEVTRMCEITDEGRSYCTVNKPLNVKNLKSTKLVFEAQHNKSKWKKK